MSELPMETTPPPVWRRRSAQVAAAVVLVVLLIAGWCWHRKGAESDSEAKPVVSVRVAQAEITPFAQPLDLVGAMVARQEATISPKVSGQIAEMALLKNRVVHRGEVLAVLESRDLLAQRNEAAAALHEAEIALNVTSRGSIPLTEAQDQKAVRDAQATLDNARRTYERRKTLYADGGISKKDLEASELEATRAEDDLRLAERSAALHRATTSPSDLATAQSKRQQAAGHLAALEAQIGYATIRAPFDGTVTDQFQYRGDFAAPGTKLLIIADTSSIIVKASLSDAAATAVHPGDAATVQPDNLPGLTLNGHVDLVGRSADTQSRAVEVWVTLPNGDGRLRANGTARLTVSSGGVPRALVVPTAAVTLDAANATGGTVMVVDAQSVAHETHVTIGAHTRDRTQIVAGLNAGQRVVFEGNYALPDGTKVQIIP